ncbi:MAG: hypothetical protein ACT4OV_11375 [Microthrixaceae bacterium]
MDVTLSIALLGAVLAILNTVWSFVQWNRSGPVVRVVLKGAFFVPGGGVLVYDADGFAEQPDPVDGARRLLAAEVTNSGRAAVDVSQVWFELGPMHMTPASRIDEASFKAIVDAGLADPMTHFVDDLLIGMHNEPLKFRLEAGSTQTWLVAADHLEGPISALRAGTDRSIRVRVGLGNGATVRSKNQAEPASLGLAG